MKNARERMDVISAYRDVGSYRGAAAICGTSHKTVKRIIEQHQAGGTPVEKSPRSRNYDEVADLVAKRVEETSGRISAKRLLPAATAAGYVGSARNFRRLVAEVKRQWRQDHPRGRRPGVWAPGETLIIDWGVLDGVHVFCAVLAWSRYRFVRFATHYRFRPDFCEAADPQSKGMVERLVGYAKDDLMVPQAPLSDLVAANAAAAVWCTEVNARVQAEICAIPTERLTTERELLATLPSLRPDFGARPSSRKVDKLSCIRFASGRYSVPNRLIGKTVTVLVDDRTLRVVEPVSGEIHAEHILVSPGETSIVDEHYGGPRPDKPRRAARPRTQSEKEFLALGPVAEAFLTGAAAAGVTKLTSEIAEILALAAAHGTDPLLVALERAVSFSRWRAADIRSILAAAGAAPTPRRAGQSLVLTLPTVPRRSLDAYRVDGGDVS